MKDQQHVKGVMWSHSSCQTAYVIKNNGVVDTSSNSDGEVSLLT